MTDLVHASKIPNLKPESFAFLCYVVNDYTGLKHEDMMFIPYETEFAKVKTSHVMKLMSEKQGSLEFWIVETHGEPAAIAIRNIDLNGDIEPTGFIQFVMRPYSQEGVLKAIHQLPIPTLGDADKVVH